MPQSVAPAFVKAEYRSADGPHVAIWPTREWSPPAGGFDYGSFPAWADDSAVDAEAMIESLIAVVKAPMSTTTVFNRYTIFTQAAPGAPAIPRMTKAITVAGLEDDGSWESAVQATMTFRTESNGISRIVFLDIPSNGSFAKSVSIDPAGVYDEIATQWTGTAVAWSGRDNTRPASFVSLTWTLNEKLRRAYDLA